MLQDTPENVYKFIYNMEEEEKVKFVVAVCVTFSVCILSTCIYCLCCRKPSRPAPRPYIPRRNGPRKIGWDISPNLDRSSIGVNFNQWRMPKAVWGPGEQVRSFDNINKLDIDRTQWEKATEAVDAVLAMLLQEIKKYANDFPGLRIGNFTRQGSSREGLKVSEADEFDALLLFSIDGIDFEARHLTDRHSWVLPEFGHLICTGYTERRIQDRYQKLFKESVFDFTPKTSKVCLNSRNLHERVFKSIIMKAANVVETRVNTRETYERFNFAIQKFSINPPSLNIQIQLKEKDGHFDYAGHLRSRMHDESYVSQSLESAVLTVIDVDIVPGLELGRDVVPDPTDWNKTMECPRYAVFKWFTEEQSSAGLYDSPPDILWRMCSSGYEKHVLDVSRGSKEQSYIVTALRIMKREFRARKELYNPPQVVTVLRSYHLKHIAFYCILYLTVMNKVGLSGVKMALTYILAFLEVCLEEQKLPHFFHANANLVYMFPDYKVADTCLKYDLFAGKSSAALRQARLSLSGLKSDMEDQYCRGILPYKEFTDIFREFVNNGRYYSDGSYMY